MGLLGSRSRLCPNCQASEFEVFSGSFLDASSSFSCVKTQ